MNHNIDNRGGWLTSLQILRALAFLGIFVSHSGLSSQLGAWGVSVFFVLSGFLMTYTYFDREIPTTLGGSFKIAIKRISKLYMLHIVMMVIAIPWEIKKAGIDLGLSSIGLWLLKIFTNLTLTQSWIPTWTVFGAFNGVAWFLSAMLFLYIMFPYVMRFLRKARTPSQIIMSSLAIYAIMILFTFAVRNVIIIGTYPDNCYWTAYTFPVLRLGDFVLGCNLGWLYLNRKQESVSDDSSRKKAIYTVMEAGAFCGVGLSMYAYISPQIILGENWFRYTNLWIPTSLLLVWLFALNKGAISKLLNNKTLLWIGNISSITFLIHNMVIQYFKIVYNHTAGKLIISFLKKMNLSEGVSSISSKIICCILALLITLLSSVVWRDIIEPKIIRQKNQKV